MIDQASLKNMIQLMLIPSLHQIGNVGSPEVSVAPVSQAVPPGSPRAMLASSREKTGWLAKNSMVFILHSVL